MNKPPTAILPPAIHTKFFGAGGNGGGGGASNNSNPSNASPSGPESAPQSSSVLGRGPSGPPAPTMSATSATSSATMNFASFLRQNYLSFGIFVCVVITIMVALVTVMAMVINASSSSNPHVQSMAASTMFNNENTHSVDQLFDPGQQQQQKLPALPLPQKTFDMVFRLTDGVLFDSNDTSTRVYDLGTGLSDMDMISIALFTCCCNDKTIVICDNRQTSIVTTAPQAAALTDYTVNCYLSHDPSVPALNTDRNKYKHRWKLIVQFGPAFSGTPVASSNTDCAFSTIYYTASRPLPPPPNPPANNINKKIW